MNPSEETKLSSQVGSREVRNESDEAYRTLIISNRIWEERDNSRNSPITYNPKLISL